MVENISASDRRVIPASVLRRIPGCAGGEAPLGVQLLHGGRNVNRNLRIDTRVGRFVLRQRVREEPRPGADPLREMACHRAAAAAGVAPAVLDAAPDCSWILMDYVQGGIWTPPRLQTPEGLRTLGACLRRLHAITPPKGLGRSIRCPSRQGRLRLSSIAIRLPPRRSMLWSRVRGSSRRIAPPSRSGQ